mmetsp:Transcript_60846/g.144858  ORF Transcript_60846/g.144858 Transcript_60846/m.144858 type:complete len:280 (+) Transcript_60846:461-1300(+)
MLLLPLLAPAPLRGKRDHVPHSPHVPRACSQLLVDEHRAAPVHFHACFAQQFRIGHRSDAHHADVARELLAVLEHGGGHIADHPLETRDLVPLDDRHAFLRPEPLEEHRHLRGEEVWEEVLPPDEEGRGHAKLCEARGHLQADVTASHDQRVRLLPSARGALNQLRDAVNVLDIPAVEYVAEGGSRDLEGPWAAAGREEQLLEGNDVFPLLPESRALHEQEPPGEVDFGHPGAEPRVDSTLGVELLRVAEEASVLRTRRLAQHVPLGECWPLVRKVLLV